MQIIISLTAQRVLLFFMSCQYTNIGKNPNRIESWEGMVLPCYFCNDSRLVLLYWY